MAAPHRQVYYEIKLVEVKMQAVLRIAPRPWTRKELSEKAQGALRHIQSQGAHREARGKGARITDPRRTSMQKCFKCHSHLKKHIS